MFGTIVLAESKVSSNPAQLALSNVYDSGWRTANNASNNNLIFIHDLGKFSREIRLKFGAICA